MKQRDLKSRINDGLGDVLARYVRFVGNRARPVLWASLLLTTIAGAYTATHLDVNTDEDALFSEDLPHMVNDRAYHEAFPSLDQTIVIVVDADTAERAQQASVALADRMRGAPNLFRSVFLPMDSFFERHALLYLEPEELESLADEVARLQPFLTTLEEDGSLRGLSGILARAVQAVGDGELPGATLEPLFGRIDAAVSTVLAGDPVELSWSELLADSHLDPQPRRRLIVAQPVTDFSKLVAVEEPLLAVRDFTRELGLDESHGVRVRTTGKIALAYEDMLVVRDQATLAGMASFVLVALLLWWALRSARLIVAALSALVAGLACTAAFAAGAVGHLNLISIAFGVLCTGLGIDFGVHLCMRYQELEGKGWMHDAAMEETVRGVGASLFLCALTTAIGFYAFVPTDFIGVAQMGLISGTGMFISFFATFTIVPAMLSVWPASSDAPSVAPVRVRLPRFPLRHPAKVAALAAVACAAACYLIPQLRFDHSPLRVRDPHTESVQTFADLLKNSRTSPWSLSVVAKDAENAEQLAQRIQKLDAVKSTATLMDFVPSDQDVKLEILEEISFFLMTGARDGGEELAPPTPDEQARALALLRDALGSMIDGAPAETYATARALRASLDTLLGLEPSRRNEILARLQDGLLGTFSEQLDRLEKGLEAGPVALADLPRGLIERMVAPDGRVRIEIFPREDLSDNAALADFVSEVRSLEPDAAGAAIQVYEAGRAVVTALREAFTASIAVIALLLLLLWRTLDDTVLAMLPLAMAAVLTGASAQILAIPFNFADIIVLPLLLGIGVDSAIHLVHRARYEGASGAELLESSTARAVTFSAITTIASFGTLALASHRGIATLGQMLTLGVTLSVICNLIVLPALLELRARWQERSATLGEST